MPDDARRAGDKKHRAAGKIRQTGARKRRTARTVLGRVMVGAHLTRILDDRRCAAAGEKIDNERCARRRSHAAGRRHRPGDGATAGDKGVLTSAVELPIALRPACLAVDVRQIVPDAHQVRHAERVQQAEQLPIRVLRQTVQRTGRIGGARGFAFAECEAPEDDVRAGAILDPAACAVARVVAVAPHLIAARVGVEDRGLHACHGHISARPGW